VQRGVLRWFLSLHSSEDAVTISPKKLTKKRLDDTEASPNGPSQESIVSSIPDTPKKGGSSNLVESNATKVPPSGPLPPPFTPSINRTLRGETLGGSLSQVSIPSLPEGISVSTLKARLNKKAAKCVSLIVLGW
jgi:DNA-3-methyladenine glycosylase II